MIYWIIAIICIVGTFSIVIVIISATRPPKNPDRLIVKNYGKWIKVTPSKYVQDIKFEKRQDYVDTWSTKDKYGKQYLAYFEGKIKFIGSKCLYCESNRKQLEKIVTLFFDLEKNEANVELINEKVNVLLNAQVDPIKKTVLIDLYNFLKIKNRYAFLFNTNTDEKFIDYILFFCSTKAESLRKLPETSFKKDHNNYIALFNLDNLSEDDLRLLFYIYAKDAFHGSYKRINDVISLQYLCLTKNDMSDDFCLEYFYQILNNSFDLATVFPSRNASTEVIARIEGYYGWPKCYDLATNLQMLTVDMYNNNNLTKRYHSEMDLFNLIRKKYKDAIYQYRDVWLGGQSLDIYIPSKKIAIEYQGQQHYKDVACFGGKQALKENQERDKRKRSICENNGIKLFVWKYSTKISEESVESFIIENKF